MDPASEFGLERHSEDFGQTLGFWGVPPGPYVVLPVLGPSTLRDTAALPVDMQASSLSFINENSAVATLSGLRVVSLRAGLLSAERLLSDVALDKYTFLRDAYLARRRSLVYDGNPPEEPEEPEEPGDAAPPAAQ
ncbi:MAG: MlaA family lipoprotein [Ideonella sp.]|nr:MlaA family lipoprotein [Ideonella sp.]